ncbi:MAG: SprT family zinc-dependent metalloprotease [Candidatus Competibacter sp.]|nr:SprT family zinc-dependent metalloprotease [Candidatus Competibacter sp.]MDG4585033.1 SprT family zinc-dependent metalloprotease [Candidatus Competibacter sp.]
MAVAELELADGRRISYRIAVSPHSHAIRFRLSARSGLVVTVPRGFDRSRLGAIVDGKRDWVADRLERFVAANPPPVGAAPPREFRLLALAETWRIEYQATPAKVTIVRTAGSGRIVVAGQVENVATCHAALHRWLVRRGRDTLAPWLERLSGETGLRYGGVSIKGQQTRWGSCSARGGINLNYKLLFLPHEWVRYVLVHELCHTVELNHSSRFWDLVRQFEPGAREISAALRNAREYLPAWVLQPATA